MKFRTILVDPPWRYENFSDKAHGAAVSHYSGMTQAELEALPVAAVAEKDAALLMWGTWPKLPEMVPIIEAWGFRYVTGFPWVKMSRAAAPRRGIGWHSQGCSEFVLIGIRGTKMTPAVEDRQVGIIFSPIGRHSAKPEQQYEFAEAYGGPFLEMFARPEPAGLFPPREGWTLVGNGVDGLEITDALRLLAECEK